MKTKVYVETSVVSYLTSAPSHDRAVARQQHVTLEWWRHRGRFDLFISEAVIAEAARGSPEMAAKRLAAVQGIPVLEVNPTVHALGRRLLAAGVLPHTARFDAVHVAVAAVNGMDRLITWNCAHIANPTARARIESGCRQCGYAPPILCTPEELGAG